MWDVHESPEVRAWLDRVGAGDLRDWLGLPAMAPLSEVVEGLQTRAYTERDAGLRADLEAALPGLTSALERSATARLPDLYEALGVAPDASFATIEAAWQRLEADAHGGEAALAWTVLGDPLRRASYDRAWRDQLLGVFEPTPFVAELLTLHLPGTPRLLLPHGERLSIAAPPERRAVVRVPVLAESLSAPVRVRAPAGVMLARTADADEGTDEITCLTGESELFLQVPPSAQRDGRVAATLVSGAVEVPIEVEIDHAAHRRERQESGRWWILATALVGAAIVLGTAMLRPDAVEVEARDWSDAPTIVACGLPLETALTVHVDGRGTATGFEVAGEVSSAAHDCIRQALAETLLRPDSGRAAVLQFGGGSP